MGVRPAGQRSVDVDHRDLDDVRRTPLDRRVGRRPFAELTRLLKGAGADVRIVMTAAATEFITPLTLQALSGHPVHQPHPAG